MNRQNIITLPNPMLQQPSHDIAQITPSIKNLAAGMIAATLDWEDHRNNEVGVALAAVQVAQLERLIVVRQDFEDKNNRTFEVFINPEISKKWGEVSKEPEGCLSVTDTYGLVPRYQNIEVKALDLAGKTVSFSASGFLARVFQHEIDHTVGRLFIDHVATTDFYHLDKEGELKPLKEPELEARRILWNR